MDDASLCMSDRLMKAQEKDQKWLAEIFMPDHQGNVVNIVSLLDPTLCQEAEFFTNGFPNKSCFLFNGFVGKEAGETLVDAIKAAAVMNGSRVRHSKRKKSSKTRLVQIDIFCHKSKHNKVNHSFNDNCVQAVSTIIQREHQIASRKGRSRSATNKIVRNENLANDEKVTPVKRSTSIRPTEKGKCCNFSFTIFCAVGSLQWYLSYSKA